MAEKRNAYTKWNYQEKVTIEKISGVYVPFWLYDYSAMNYDDVPMLIR